MEGSRASFWRPSNQSHESSERLVHQRSGETAAQSSTGWSHESDLGDRSGYDNFKAGESAKKTLFDPPTYDSGTYGNFHQETHPIDPPVSPSNTTQWRPHEHRVVRFWRWEVVSLCIAIGLLSAIIAILSHYHGQKLPEWPLSINLNTLIALLSTIFRASMLVVVAQILGQAKWSWFTRHPRPLHHLQDFDEASRSVLGSARLLGVVFMRGGTAAGAIALSGALITIMSFAIGPFTQQAIKSRACTQIVANTNSTLPVANYVPDTSNFYRVAAGEWEVEVDMKGTMINGLTNPQGNDTAVLASCPTGNCTFPDYGTGVTHASIGMCSKCIDTTSLISAPNDVGNISLPDGTTVNFGSDAPWLTVRMSNLSYAQSMFPADFAEVAPTSLANISILSVSQSPCANSSGVLTCPHDWSNITYAGTADVVATSCTIYPCIRSYFGSVTSGILDERVVSTKPAPFNFYETNESYSFNIYNYTALRSPCVLDSTVYTEANVSAAPQSPERRFVTINIDGKNITAPDECLYKLYGVYGQALQAFMYTLFNGRCNYNARQGGELWCGDWWWLSPLYSQRNASFASLSRQIDDFATAVTNKFRSTGSGNYVPRAADALAVVAQGEVFETTVCTYLDWRWLLLPAGLVVASAALLVWMVMRNYAEPGQPVWKGNVLPLLFFGLRNGFGAPGAQTPAAQPRLMELDQVQDLARRMIVKYHTGAHPGFDVGPGGGDGDVRPRRDRDIDMDSLLGDR